MSMRAQRATLEICWRMGRDIGKKLSLGSHNGELNLSGDAIQFTVTDRERCPTRQPCGAEVWTASSRASSSPKNRKSIMRRDYQKVL